ncbi:MAG TPA: FAD-dependent monooxygenase, partial [Bacillota bacterium]
MRIVVIGGGIGGLAAATALSQKGFDVRVYEAAPELQPVGKGIWLPTNAMLVLQRLGLDAPLLDLGVALEAVEILDAATGPVMHVDLDAVKKRLGQPFLSIHRHEVHQVLLAHLRPDSLHLGKRCVDIRRDLPKPVLRFADGDDIEGDLVIAADGIHSRLRRLLFPQASLRYAGQTCYRGIAAVELPPALRRRALEVWGGDSRFGYSAIGEDQVYWFAPVTAPPAPAGKHPVDPAELLRRYRSFPDPIPALLENSDPNAVIRTDLYDLTPLDRWARGRVVLLGDAAHAMTPNLAQGGAQAIEDAYVLAQCLASHGDLDEALRAYQHKRVPRVRRVV